tara:strand:- start:854 stop:2113 length:1260 start_codon:yes stop_codon:yes gene_type:complete
MARKHKKTEDFVVYSSNLDEFLRLRNFTDKELDNCVSKVKTLVTSNKSSIRDYIHLLVTCVVYDHKKYIHPEKDDETYDALFEAVLEAYPMFQIDSICEMLNTKVITKELGLKDSNSPAASVKNLKELKAIEKGLKTRVIGQDTAVGEVIDALKLRAAGFSGFSSFFFIGPTGVGKTELARALAEGYLGSKKKLLKINCGEYSNPHEYAKLIGSPPGYIGFNEKGILSEKADESSEWVILFDEIEKASGKLHNLLLGFLDDGTIQDNHGTELNFKNSVIVFTSNIGMEHVGKKMLGFGSGELSYDDVKINVMDAFKGKFPPEFINRIDQVVHFNQLTRGDTAKIAKLNLKDLPIKPTKKLIDWVVAGGYSKEYGARNLKRFIRKNVTLKLADALLEGPKFKQYVPLFLDGVLNVSGISE